MSHTLPFHVDVSKGSSTAFSTIKTNPHFAKLDVLTSADRFADFSGKGDNNSRVSLEHARPLSLAYTNKEFGVLPGYRHAQFASPQAG